MASLSLDQRLPDVDDDIGYFFVMANVANGKLSSAFEHNTRLIVDEVAERRAWIIHLSIIFLLLTVGGAVFFGSVVFYPTLLHVERSKIYVLTIILSVPPSARETLRQQARQMLELVENAQQDDYYVANDGKGMAALSTGAAVSRAASPTFSNMISSSRHTSRSGHRRRSLVDIHRTADGGAAPANGAVVDLVTGDVAPTRDDEQHQVSAPTADDDTPSKMPHYNLWTGAAVRVGTVRLAIFVLLFIGYFGSLLVMTINYSAELGDTVQRAFSANLRTPHMTYSFLFLIEHLFHSKDEVLLADPLDPTTFCADSFDRAALTELDKATTTYQGLIYGHTSQIKAPLDDKEHLDLLFGSACDVDPFNFAATYEDAAKVPHLLPNCPSVQNGVLTQGLFSAHAYLSDHMLELLDPKYNKVFEHFLGEGAPQHSPAVIEQARTIFKNMYDLYFNYIKHFTRYDHHLSCTSKLWHFFLMCS